MLRIVVADFCSGDYHPILNPPSSSRSPRAGREDEVEQEGEAARRRQGEEGAREAEA